MFDQEITDLLTGMLQFNPSHRLSAKKCLKSPIFDKIRIKKLERSAKTEIINISFQNLKSSKN